MIRAVIFDFDGLILDTEVPDFTAWREMVEEYGGQLPISVWASVIGSQMKDNGFDPIVYIEQQTGRKVADPEQLHARRHARTMQMIEGRTALPGVEARIAEAKELGLKLAVASSSSSQWVRGHLGRLGLLGNFDVIRTSDDVAMTKPAPDLFLSALDALGVSASEAIIFEDSPNGVLAGNRAGVFTVAVPNEITAQLDLSHADLKITSLADITLADLISQSNGSKHGA